MMKPSRNEPCSCGSGKKFKNCCIDKDYYEQLFYRQSKLMTNLSDDMFCNEIIEIGNKIIVAKRTYEFTTGAYTNIANAYLHLGANNSNLQKALEFSNKALELKSNNFQALVVKYSTNMLSRNYSDAHSVLKEFRGNRINASIKNSILTTYQIAVLDNQKNSYDSTTVDILKDLTDTLFDLMGDYEGLWMLAHEFYRGVGNDVLRAYELGKQFVENHDVAEAYVSLGFLCNDERIDRAIEGIKYLKKAIEIADDEEVLFAAKTNLVTAYIKNNDYDKAFSLVNELIKETPNNANFSNYAELLKRKGEYEDAIKWSKKALFLVEDDTTLLVLADTYKKNKQYELAAEYFIKCIGAIESEGTVYRFTDACGTERYSFATNTSIKKMLLESYLGVIESFNHLSKYSMARAYLKIGLEHFPTNRSLESLNSVIPAIEDIQSEYLSAKETLEHERKISEQQRNNFRKWASDLILLQNSTHDYDLDMTKNWDEFETQMNQVIMAMKSSVQDKSGLITEIEQSVQRDFPNLTNESKRFLTTANFLFETHKNNIIDFAPIVIEYSKIVERQLKHLLGNRLNDDVKMLGQILYKINDESIMPYKNSISKLYRVNKLRKNGAHTGLLTKDNAEEIRRLLFEEGLLVMLT